MNSVKLAALGGAVLLLASCGSSEEPTEAEPTAAETVAAAPADGVPLAFAQCKACHSVKPGENGIGPTLAGIYNTKAGEVPNFEFSPAMLASGLTWDDATLDKYLADPRAVVPGTKMSFGGLKDDAKRKEVVEYLKTL